MKKAAAAKKYRRLAREAATEQCIASGPWQKAVLQAVFFHRQKRRRDGTNHNAMLKSAQDGIVDSGIAEDDDSEHLTTLPPIFRIDKAVSRVELTVTRVV